MDLSFFDRKKEIIKETEIITVDFKQRVVMNRQVVNNLKIQPKEQGLISQVINKAEGYIKNINYNEENQPLEKK